MKFVQIACLALCGAAFQASGQASITILDQNNAKAYLSDVGILFNNLPAFTAGYEIPSGSGKNAVYTASMWFGGEDFNGQVKMALPHFYSGSSQDMWPGALETSGAATAITPNPLNGTLWTVSVQEINDHILNFQQPGYVAPDGILNWPAHGNVAQGQAYYLAPFVDVDGDGMYEPTDGEYPCIKGDKATYIILNDKGGIHGSGTDPIGIEQHYMVYQYVANALLNDVTFIDTKIINRGTQTLYDFVASFFVDGDLGNYSDDFAGCDSSRNLLYFYNSDSMDEDNGGEPGYGTAPPAVGMVCLSHEMSSARVFTNNGGPGNSDPTVANEYLNVMHGLDADGNPILDNNGMVTTFQYAGDPNNLATWSELSNGNAGGDRRGVMSTELDVLVPFQVHEMSYALVFGQGSNNLNSVSQLFAAVDMAQDFYDNGMTGSCYAENAGVSESEMIDLQVYPNPSTGTFVVNLTEVSGDVQISLLDMAGRVVAGKDFAGGALVDFVTNAAPGVYVVRVVSGRGEAAQRVVVE